MLAVRTGDSPGGIRLNEAVDGWKKGRELLCASLASLACLDLVFAKSFLGASRSSNFRDSSTLIDRPCHFLNMSKEGDCIFAPACQIISLAGLYIDL